jgi:hypothetical protein
MPQLRTKLSERMANKRRAKSRSRSVAFTKIPMMMDVLFAGCDGEHLGEVVAKASPRGREAVEKLFPGCHVEWRGLGPDTAVFPDDWREFTFVIPGLLHDIEKLGLKHNLPQHLIDLKPMNEVCSDQFAVLMALGAIRQGVRAGVWSTTQNKISTFCGPSTFN